jgi:REP element-mobilizing transposase RayT
MKYNSDIHHRRSIRLKGYDYSQAGLYFITICTQNRLHLFGEIDNGEMILNDAGMMIKTVWHEIPEHYNGINIDAFQIMPNHIHGIIRIINECDRDHVHIHVGAGPRACPDICPDIDTHIDDQPNAIGQPRGVAPTMSLPDIVHRFKTLTTKRYTDGVKQNNWLPCDKRLWQRNYYEHIIR